MSLLLIFVTAFLSAAKGNLLITINGTDLADIHVNETIKLIQDDQITLKCLLHGSANYTIAWFIYTEYHNNVLLNNTLEMHSLRVQDIGNYTCRAMAKEQEPIFRTLHIELLFPPSYPRIDGSSHILAGEACNLTCVSEGKPEPTYEWRYGDSQAPILTTSNTYIAYPTSSMWWLTCVASSVLVPSLGNHKRVHVYNTMTLLVYHVAKVTHFESKGKGIGWSFIYNENEDIAIECKVYAIPYAKIYWEKYGSGEVLMSGPWLMIFDANVGHSGKYICNANNTVLASNGSLMQIHDSSEMEIKIIESQSKNTTVCDCPNKTCNLETTTNSGLTPLSEKPPKDDSENPPTKEPVLDTSPTVKIIVLSVLAAIGWTASLTLLAMQRCFCKKCSKEKKLQQVPYHMYDLPNN